MRSWLIYIAAFIGALIAVLGAFRLVSPVLWAFGEDAFFFVGMVFAPATCGIIGFTAIYATAHQWWPSFKQFLLGAAVSNALGLVAVLLVFSDVAGLGTAIGFAVLSAFLAGRYLTVTYGNG